VFNRQFSWEFFISLPFDFSFISGKRKFRWPAVTFSLFLLRSFHPYVHRQIFYFVGRYSLLGAFIGTRVSSLYPFTLLPHCNGFTSALPRLTSDRACIQCSRSLSVRFTHAYAYRELNCQALYTFNLVFHPYLLLIFVNAHCVRPRVTSPLAWLASTSRFERK
jgi:hypothetical protein